MHSWLMSSIVLSATILHLPTATFSSALSAEKTHRRNAVVSKYGRWRMILMFWKRHFMMSLIRRRNSGHGSSGLSRMEGSSSYHFRSCASWAAVSEGESSGDSTRRSWILVAIEQKTEEWISGRILSCSMYCGLFGGGMVGTLFCLSASLELLSLVGWNHTALAAVPGFKTVIEGPILPNEGRPVVVDALRELNVRS